MMNVSFYYRIKEIYYIVLYINYTNNLIVSLCIILHICLQAVT